MSFYKCCTRLLTVNSNVNNGLCTRTRSFKTRNISEEVTEIIQRIKNPILCGNNVTKISDSLDASISSCLLGNKSPLNCINTYIQDFPSGHEKGRYLALDLGGTNFRSMLIDINDKGEDVRLQKTQVSEAIRSSGGYELFEFMANFTHDKLFNKFNDTKNDEYPTVLTFSFPVKMAAPDKGTIVSFSKGYNCKEVIGKDLGQLVIEAFSKKGINIKLVAIINDTVGTMMASRWKNQFTAGGIVLGTGTNACYLEEACKLKDFKSEKKSVLINTEWGAFGDMGELDFIRTPFDNSLDKTSSNPGKQTFEKMVSGMYVGEIVRQVLLYLGEHNVLCSKDFHNVLKEPFSFPTHIISKLEEEEITGNCILCKPFKKYYRRKSSIQMLNYELKGRNPYNFISVQDYHIINEVCKAVAERSARLAGIAVACLARRINQPSIVFGIDGTLYEKTRAYQKIIPKMLSFIVPDKDVQLIQECDGSIRGAAYLAAALTHKKQ